MPPNKPLQPTAFAAAERQALDSPAGKVVEFAPRIIVTG